MTSLRVLVAPDSFKGTASAAAAAAAIARGWRRVRPHDDVRELPQADGGEGTIDAVAASLTGSTRRSAGLVTGPDGRPVPGEWLLLPDGSAMVELAQCSGITLMRRLDALGASTRGLGEMIRHAIDAGAAPLVIALGGSASTDGGAGALSALGLVLRDLDGRVLPDGGGSLRHLASADRSGLRIPPPTTLLTDVRSPLLGDGGAARVFAPQKGADAPAVETLETGLVRLASILGGRPGDPGMGAAGGSAYGFATLWGASVRSGAEYVAAVTGLTAAIPTADVLLTGEGRFDSQSIVGKVAGSALTAARAAGVRSGIVAGTLASDPGVWSTSLAVAAGTVDAAMADASRWLEAAGADAARALGDDGAGRAVGS